ncbi:MAG: acylneuraminate cytidylyltransferase family protein [Clostridia bacterium]|nr:acylneuraminate cytidylyltransferase family protein [Clostridia bacterium]
MKHDYKLIAMIPARMGSKRIPKKNIRYMLDKPLIQYPIEFALQSQAFDSVWVNTESEELGKICENLGAKFHKRPAELADDKATNRDFTYEFLKKHACDYVVMINPTSPTLRQETVNRFLSFVRENEFDCVMSVESVKAEAFYAGKKINFDGKSKVPSQNLGAVQYIVWALTAWKRDCFIRMQEEGECPIFGGNMGLFEIPKDECADLDTDEDWNIAEGILYSRKSASQSRIKYLEVW